MSANYNLWSFKIKENIFTFIVLFRHYFSLKKKLTFLLKAFQCAITTQLRENIVYIEILLANLEKFTFLFFDRQPRLKFDELYARITAANLVATQHFDRVRHTQHEDVTLRREGHCASRVLSNTIVPETFWWRTFSLKQLWFPVIASHETALIP